MYNKNWIPGWQCGSVKMFPSGHSRYYSKKKTIAEVEKKHFFTFDRNSTSIHGMTVTWNPICRFFTTGYLVVSEKWYRAFFPVWHHNDMRKAVSIGSCELRTHDGTWPSNFFGKNFSTSRFWLGCLHTRVCWGKKKERKKVGRAKWLTAMTSCATPISAEMEAESEEEDDDDDDDGKKVSNKSLLKQENNVFPVCVTVATSSVSAHPPFLLPAPLQSEREHVCVCALIRTHLDLKLALCDVMKAGGLVQTCPNLVLGQLHLPRWGGWRVKTVWDECAFWCCLLSIMSA